MYGFGKTDIGALRAKNEDSIFVRNEAFGDLPNLFVISDGMGGHKAGEEASRRAIEFFCEYVLANASEDKGILDCMIEAVSYANVNVHELSVTNSSLSGMGATFSACAITEDRVYIAHVGDSRVYGIKEGVITQLTTDHTYVNDLVKSGMITKKEARNHPQKNIITRALGVGQEVDIDAIPASRSEYDYILACSDGLSGMISDEEICYCSTENLPVEQRVENMVRLANKNGGYDNVSIILIDLNAPDSGNTGDSGNRLCD